MSVAFDAVGPTSTGTTSATSSISWTHTAGAGAGTVLVELTVSTLAAFGTISFSAVTYGGNAMTLLGSRESGPAGNGGGGTFLYGITGQASGANTVSATCSVTPSDKLIGNSISFTGAGSFGTAVTGSDTGAGVTSGSLALTGTGASNLAFCGQCNGSGGTTWTAGTSRFTGGSGAASAASDVAGATQASTAGTVTFSWTQNNDNYAAIAVEVKAAAVAAAGPVPYLSQNSGMF